MLDIDFARAIPVLPFEDLEKTRTFLETRLGFAVIVDDDSYLIAKRDEIEIHFAKTEPDKGHVSSCYIRGGQIAQLYQEYTAKKIQSLSAFETRPWNMAEFHITDPFGNVIRFGCIPEE